MEGSNGPIGAWLRCYRCWSQELEVQVHYEGIHRIDPVSGERAEADSVESCSGPDAADSLAYAAFGDHGTREFFTHVRFHKHDEDQIVVHLLVELYARSSEEATSPLSPQGAPTPKGRRGAPRGAARGPPAAAPARAPAPERGGL